jgi:ketosteroid isomerase-like protein
VSAEQWRAPGDRRAILAAIEDFRIAYDAGDLDTVAGYYSDDLVKLRQGAPPETKAVLVKRLVETFRDHHGRLEVTIDEIEISGDLAFVRGTFTVALTHRTRAETRTARRRFLEVWRRETAGWRVCRTADNSGEE